MTEKGSLGWIALTMLAGLALTAACTSRTPTAAEQDLLDRQVEAEATATPRPGPNEPKPDPIPYRPGGPVGDAAAYDALIAELAATVPAELRNEVPWPDLRNPDPIIAQQDIFDLWIWMNENHPDPRLVDLIAPTGSPNRPGIVTTFATMFRDGLLAIRPTAPYRAYDQQAITFESAGLPLWLARDVPPGAAVIYYTDDSGPTETRRRLTGEVIDESPALPPRDWVSILVETEVGWLLWRDQLIEPGDAELNRPDTVPAPETDRPRFEL